MALVGLISCVSGKSAHATEARDLYYSPLFTKARKYVEQRCDTWYILSAKYGLVDPRQVIAPYEETLNTKSRVERKQWAQKVWADLQTHLYAGDHVVVITGERYREHLVPRLVEHGCVVEVPMEGLGIGRQLQWLSNQLSESTRQRDLDRLYRAFGSLESAFGRKRLMSECTGQQDWPQNGLYFFFEPGECRKSGAEPRVVRVGTHGVSRGSKATLWNRLRTHRGTGEGSGNHRSSIFRLHVGAALAAKDASLAVPMWAVGEAADATIRKKEEHLERAVSAHIGGMSVLWLAVDDEASPASDRAYLERNLIGLLVGKAGPVDLPSNDWLGRFSPDKRIRDSGLWNLDFLEYSYSTEFLDVLVEYVLITTGKKPQPPKPIAPRDWYMNERQRVPRNQLSLFEG
jgi:hypothetical protein